MGIQQPTLYDKALVEKSRTIDKRGEGRCMRYITVLLLWLMLAPPTWANEKESSAGSEPPPQSSGDAHLRVQDLPKSVQDALVEIQRLSAKVEPEIEKFGSRFRQEVDQAVKKLQQAVKSQRSPATKETP
jgi:hypothetical protein